MEAIRDSTSKRERNGKVPGMTTPVGRESTAIDIELSSKEEKGKAPLLVPPFLTRAKKGKAPHMAASVFTAPSAVGPSKAEKARYKRGIAIFDLVLKLGALISATITMGTTDQTLPFFTQFLQFQASYDDLPAFTFFVIANAIVEKILNMAPITFNKNSVPGDKSAIVPGGIRIGTPALTTRGFTEKDFMLVADFIHQGVKITQEAKKLAPGPKLQDFLKFITVPDFPLIDQVLDLKRKVEDFATQFPLPGF